MVNEDAPKPAHFSAPLNAPRYLLGTLMPTFTRQDNLSDLWKDCFASHSPAVIHINIVLFMFLMLSFVHNFQIKSF